jgi:Domain of unknown function (DUF6265)
MNLFLFVSFVAAVAPRATVSDFAWLAGHWRGEGLGGQCEEIWSEPLAGTMMGSFRLVKSDRVEFYEMMVLVPEGDGIALKVKHFTEGFTGWEEKNDSVSFVLESVDGRSARFRGLTMERDSDRLEVRVRIKHKDGTVRDEPFVFRRYDPGS